jgi:type VI secretion system protein ImpH
MAAPGWRSDRPLSRCLREDFAQFDWYQLVRLLLTERAGSATPAMLDRHIRFRADLSMAFPASEVTAVLELDRQRPIAVATPNYSLAGYLGPLPESFVEWLQERRLAGDRTMADFLDLFNHRIGSLRYRIKSRVYPALNRNLPQRTPLAARLSAVMGLAEPQLMRQLPVQERALLGVAGLLANRRRNVDTIERVLARYLASPVVIAQFRGSWQPIPRSDQTLLGKKNSVLGKNTVLGRQVWDQAAGIEVRIGPLAHVAFFDLLPNGPRHDGLTAMLRFLTDRQVDCCVRLVARAPDVPGILLSAANDSTTQLGRTTWVGDARQGEREAMFMIPAYATESARAA